MGHFVSSPRGIKELMRREKNEEKVNDSAETEEILTCSLRRPAASTTGPYTILPHMPVYSTLTYCLY